MFTYSRQLQSLLQPPQIYALQVEPDPGILREYENIIQEQLAAGIIEKIPNQPSEEVNNEDVHQLPYRAAIRKNRETTKHRRVYFPQ